MATATIKSVIFCETARGNVFSVRYESGRMHDYWEDELPKKIESWCMNNRLEISKINQHGKLYRKWISK